MITVPLSIGSRNIVIKYHNHIDNPSDTVKTIIELVERGGFKETRHATIRMQQRNVSYQDIRNAFSTALEFSFEKDEHERYVWVVDGFDLDDDPLRVVCVLRQSVVLITVF